MYDPSSIVRQSIAAGRDRIKLGLYLLTIRNERIHTGSFLCIRLPIIRPNRIVLIGRDFRLRSRSNIEIGVVDGVEVTGRAVGLFVFGQELLVRTRQDRRQVISVLAFVETCLLYTSDAADE